MRIEACAIGYVEDLPCKVQVVAVSEVNRFVQPRVDVKVAVADEVVTISHFARIGSAQISRGGIRIVERLGATVFINMFAHLDGPCLHHVALILPVRTPSQAIGDAEGKAAGYAGDS